LYKSNNIRVAVFGLQTLPRFCEAFTEKQKRFIDTSRRYACYLQTGLWTQKEFANHAMPLVAFTEYANAREFKKMCIVSGLHGKRKGINRGFEPCPAWWQLEQQCEELPVG